MYNQRPKTQRSDQKLESISTSSLPLDNKTKKGFKKFEKDDVWPDPPPFSSCADIIYGRSQRLYA